jgi:hypothetical protein
MKQQNNNKRKMYLNNVVRLLGGGGVYNNEFPHDPTSGPGFATECDGLSLVRFNTTHMLRTSLTNEQFILEQCE